VSDDGELCRAVEDAPAACRRAIETASGWSESFTALGTPTAAIAYGTGPAWAAALETALLVKEVARIPCEGVETREGVTAAMTGLSTGPRCSPRRSP
jgi:glucosamine 6-phosphate synthetase-like amidotransferase/phosphosugar isomerase protein